MCFGHLVLQFSKLLLLCDELFTNLIEPRLIFLVNHTGCDFICIMRRGFYCQGKGRGSVHNHVILCVNRVPLGSSLLQGFYPFPDHLIGHSQLAEVLSLVFHPTISVLHDLGFKCMLMLFSKIEEMALCILHLPCDCLKYVWFHEIFCEISESHLPLSILGYSLSY